ncbi:MAG: glycosyltransferase N-terminal domain-containing protein [Planctomycetota bacterium]
MGKGVDAIYGAGLLAASPVIALSLLRTGKWRTDWKARLGRVSSAGLALPEPDRKHPTILIHAVSVGETNLVAPLIDRLLADPAAPRVVVATTTQTGFDRGVSRYADRCAVVRYPLDFSASVARFLDAIRPSVAASVELEVWPNFTQACARRGVPVAVVNGRLSERSFRGYRRFVRWVGPMFRRLAAVGAQTPDYAERFVAMGVPAVRVSVLGNMKWDAVRLDDPDLPGRAETLARELGVDRTKPVVVAGSTGPGEEAELLKALPDGVQLILAPRKPERFEEVAQAAAHFDAVRLSRVRAGESSPESTRVFLIDTIGDLTAAYALADVALVGRSWNGMYGSNPVEPVAAGAAAIIGPDHADFSADVDALVQAGGLKIAPQPMPAALALLADPDARMRMVSAGRTAIRAQQGAADRYAAMLLGLAGAGGTGDPPAPPPAPEARDAPPDAASDAAPP